LDIRLGIFVSLAILTAIFLGIWLAEVLKDRRQGSPESCVTLRAPTLFELAIGFVTNFFDTLGVGSYAPTTSIFKLFKVVPDENIPGTLNIGDLIPTVMEAFIFMAIVAVEVKTLALMILASMMGSWLGAGVVASWPRRNIQIGMGLALLAAAGLFLGGNLGWFPLGGTAVELSGLRLAIGMVGSFVFGAFMMLGIGCYAPIMILTSLLGMNPTTAFPIMMGSCAFLMTVGNVRFVQKKRYNLGTALGLTLGGIPAVLIAAYVVKSLPLKAVKWLVIGVVLYTSTLMLKSARAESR
jgi:uncharacterized membrane protein YfcA